MIALAVACLAFFVAACGFFRLETFMTTITQLVTDLNALTEQATKIETEVASLLERIEDLEEVIANGPPLPAEVMAALDALKAQVAVVDNLVPDAPPAPV